MKVSRQEYDAAAARARGGRAAELCTLLALYRPRRPTATPLYPVVPRHAETFLAAAEDGDPVGFGVSAWVERDFRAYLRTTCIPQVVPGILAHGFACARCGDCGQERLVPFSCRGRGACPSCNARRMAEVGAFLTDHVLPHLPVRHPHFHFHVLALDGVLSEEPTGSGRLRFQLGPPQPLAPSAHPHILVARSIMADLPTPPANRRASPLRAATPATSALPALARARSRILPSLSGHEGLWIDYPSPTARIPARVASPRLRANPLRALP